MKKIYCGLVLAVSSLFSVASYADEVKKADFDVSVEVNDLQSLSKPGDIVKKTVIKYGDTKKVLNMTVEDMTSNRYEVNTTFFKKVNSKWKVENSFNSIIFNNSSVSYSSTVETPLVLGIDYDKEDKSIEVDLDTINTGNSFFISLEKKEDDLFILYNIEISNLISNNRVFVPKTKYLVDSPNVKVDSLVAFSKTQLNKELVLFENENNKVVVSFSKDLSKKTKANVDSTK